MSYEGYDQIICRCGAYNTRDCHDYSGACSGCKRVEFIAPEDFINSVDDTNCDQYGHIPKDVIDKHFCIEAEVVETCNLSHKHITKEAKYRVPARNEAEKLRTYYDSEKEETLLID